MNTQKDRLERLATSYRNPALPFVPFVVTREGEDNTEAERLLEEMQAGRLAIGTIIRLIRTNTLA